MPETVSINGLTLCHKNSTGMVTATLPDVCKTPSYPVPYPNIAFSRDLAKGTKTVKSHDGAMNGIKGCEFSVSIGDDPGTGGGVKSGVNKDKATFLMWSPNVKMEGKPVTRLTDKMLMNKGNTISAGGYFTGPVTGASRATLDLLCQVGCAALASGTNQAGVEAALRATLASTGSTQNGLFPEVTFDPAGNMYRGANGAPQSRYGVPGSRIDVVTVLAGQPTEFVEMKFPGDRLRGTQQQRYEAIARKNGKQLQLMNLPQDCNNCEGSRPQESTSNSSVWWWILGGAAVIGAGACIYFTAGICAIPLGVGGGIAAAA